MKVVSEIPCFSCREPCHCCTEQSPDQNLIMITLHDAERICKATGKKISDFAEFRHVKQPRSSELDEDEQYYMLDKSALFMKKINHKCVFLKDYKCSIHKHRPGLCRMYPFWYECEGDDIKIVRMNKPEDDECPALKGEKRLCSGVFAKMDETKDSLKVLAKRYDTELEHYNSYKSLFRRFSPDELFSRLKHSGLL
ncbi:YkgJ family cysteine cluster protein [Candidatus Woesearchaeota archaeon]|nr:YkgJ family cysteine cluster protein [Candidatus Woesearchaeota archaeon]